MRPRPDEDFELRRRTEWIVETQRQLQNWKRSLEPMMPYGQDATPDEIAAVHEQYTDNVTALPKREEPAQPEWLVGPFEEYRVLVDDRVMPRLTGFREGDKIWLVVDGRFACGPFDEEQARQAARLAGQAMAVTAGYPHLGATTKDRPFAPLGMAIDTLPSA